MSNSVNGSTWQPNWNSVAEIRKRPAMYVGDNGFWGFINYVVCAFDLLLDNDASWIEFEVVDEALHFRSDARITAVIDERDELCPFEADTFPRPSMQPRSPDGAIIVALSCDFHVKLCDGKHWTELVCDQGRRVTFRQEPSTSEIGVDLKFAPDCSFFKIVDSSPAVVHSYCRRTSILHAGIAFRVKNGERITEYKSENGIRDFFTAITTPYQMTHEPIHIKEVDGDLAVEVVFVFHSWSENQVWSFANKGRVPDGGTHEAGLLDAISKSCTTPRGSAAGILAVLAIEYPHVTYEGCIKGRIGNPELRDRISEIVLAGIQEWGRENPEEVERYQSVERFQFADIW